MSHWGRFISLLIGKVNTLSAFGYKSARLRAYLSLLSIVVGLFYILADYQTGVQGNTVFYLLAIAAGLVCLILN